MGFLLALIFTCTPFRSIVCALYSLPSIIRFHYIKSDESILNLFYMPRQRNIRLVVYFQTQAQSLFGNESLIIYYLKFIGLNVFLTFLPK